MMFYEAAGGAGFAGLPLRYQTDLDLSRQLALGRAVLVAEVAGLTSQLSLETSPDASGADSAGTSRTILRFVLPVQRPQD
jgi:hypothetical protein